MISKSSILINLKLLDAKYKTTRDCKESLFFSKLAILELCGWIEESMDDLIMRCARSHLKEPINIKKFEDDIVRRTYGFDYKRHFRRMLIHLIGIINVERLERTIDQKKLSSLDSTLKLLKQIRDTEAHTHIKGITRNINAPSVTLNQFQPVYDGLKEFERFIRRARL